MANPTTPYSDAMLIVRSLLSDDNAGAIAVMQTSDYPESVFLVLAKFCALLLDTFGESRWDGVGMTNVTEVPTCSRCGKRMQWRKDLLMYLCSVTHARRRR